MQEEMGAEGGEDGTGQLSNKGVPETSNDLLSKTSRAVTSAFPTMIRLSVCSFGFTQVVAFCSMGYFKPAWSWENLYEGLPMAADLVGAPFQLPCVSLHPNQGCWLPAL